MESRIPRIEGGLAAYDDNRARGYAFVSLKKSGFSSFQTRGGSPTEVPADRCDRGLGAGEAGSAAKALEAQLERRLARLESEASVLSSKEAERLQVEPVPSVHEFRQWTLDLQRLVATSSSRPARPALAQSKQAPRSSSGPAPPPPWWPFG